MSNWLTYSPTSGYGNGTITISASTLSEIQDRVSAIIAKNNTYSVSASTSILQKSIPPTSITFSELIWTTDVSWSGGTATKDNCYYKVLGYYSDGSIADVTSIVSISGSLYVSETEDENRHSAGTLTLTATYDNLSCSGSVVAYQEKIPEYAKYMEFDILSGGTIYWCGNSAATNNSIYYKKNSGDWINLIATPDGTGSTITVNNGDVVKFKANFIAAPYDYCYFKSDSGVRLNMSGNIMSLLGNGSFSNLTTVPESAFDGLFCGTGNIWAFNGFFGVVDASNLIMPATNLGKYCYRNMFAKSETLIAAPTIGTSSTIMGYGSCNYMFQECTSLTTPPALPATTLAEICYASMFEYCTGLTITPVLPANAMAKDCYSYMFKNCTSLTASTELPATILADGCYYGMFNACHSLMIAPSILPATTLSDNCYREMFYWCTGLTTSPQISGVTLGERCCESMFQDCWSLETGPSILPATTLANYCYNNMFRSCKSLTRAPILPSNEDPGREFGYFPYDGMFNGCNSLNYIKCLARKAQSEISNEIETGDRWVSNVASTGTFVRYQGENWSRGDWGIPEGWTIQNA